MVVNMYGNLTKKREKLVYKTILENVPGATNVSNDYYIDFEDGSSISVDDIREIINLYDRIDDEIERYIEDNDLDNVFDEEEIKRHFKEYDENGFFDMDQATLKSLAEFALIVYRNFL